MKFDFMRLILGIAVVLGGFLLLRDYGAQRERIRIAESSVQAVQQVMDTRSRVSAVWDHKDRAARSKLDAAVKQLRETDRKPDASETTGTPQNGLCGPSGDLLTLEWVQQFNAVVQAGNRHSAE